MWKFRQYLFCLILTLTNFIERSSACNGYTVKLNSAKHCSPDSLIKIENPGATLDTNCNLILTGCLVISKGFKTAKGSYTLKKAPMPPMEGEMDFCEAVGDLDDPAVGNIAKMFNAPTKCPVQASKICGGPNKKINLSKYKNQLGIASGTIDVKVELEHDTGKSCLEVNVNIAKGRKG